MRILCFILLLGLVGTQLPGCDTTAQSPAPKFCIADIAKLMRDSVPGKEGVKVIESLQSQMQKELDAIQDKLEKNPQDKDAMEALQQTYAQAQQKIQVEGQNIANQIMDHIQNEIDKFRSNNGYDMIIASDALLSYAPAVDKTAAIMAEIDKQKFEFKPMQSASPATPEISDQQPSVQQPSTTQSN